MSITGLAVAKAAALGIGLTAATGVAAVATGNAHGLAIALQHIPSWTHAHSILTGLSHK